jgi:Winged helix DNA-binding domain
MVSASFGEAGKQRDLSTDTIARSGYPRSDAIADHGGARNACRQQPRLRHLATLETAGYVAVTKAFHNKRPRTTALATPAGRTAYAAHVAALRAIMG